MQKFVLPSILIATLLSGCFGGDRVFVAKHHGIDIAEISLHVQEKYKIGTDEKSLIRDFKAKGYFYVYPGNPNDKRMLIYPRECAIHGTNMAGEQVYIAWISDSHGLISAIETPIITGCHSIPP